MTRLFYTICFVCSFSILSLAQPFIGQRFIGGSFFFNKGTTETPASSQTLDDLSYGFGPSLGVMLNKRTAIMGGIFFNRYERISANASDLSNKQIRNSYGTSLMVRRLFPLVEKVGLYLQGGISYSWMNGKTRDINGSIETTRNEFKENAFSAGVTPGIYFFATDQIALEASFGNINYSNTSRKLSCDNGGTCQNSNRSQFSLSGNTQLSFGIRYYWGVQKVFKTPKIKR